MAAVCSGGYSGIAPELRVVNDTGINGKVRDAPCLLHVQQRFTLFYIFHGAQCHGTGESAFRKRFETGQSN